MLNKNENKSGMYLSASGRKNIDWLILNTGVDSWERNGDCYIIKSPTVETISTLEELGLLPKGKLVTSVLVKDVLEARTAVNIRTGLDAKTVLGIAKTSRVTIRLVNDIDIKPQDLPLMNQISENKNIKILPSDKEISQIAGKDNHFVGSPSNEICNDINWLIKNTQMSWGMFSDYYCTETDVGAGDKIKDLGIQGNVIYCARGVRKFAVKSHLVRMARTSQLQKTK